MSHIVTPRNATLLLVIVAIILLLFALFDDQNALSMNLVTEFLGIVATVFLVDFIFREHQADRELPIRLAAVREVSFLCNRLTSLWVQILQASISLQDDRAMLSDAKLGQFDMRLAMISRRLNFDARAPVSPERSWDRWLVDSVADAKKRINSCLTRYPTGLNPIIVKHLQELETSSLFLIIELLPTIKLENARSGRTELGTFLRSADQTFEEFLTVMDGLCSSTLQMHRELRGRHRVSVDLPDVSDEYFRAVLNVELAKH